MSTLRALFKRAFLLTTLAVIISLSPLLNAPFIPSNFTHAATQEFLDDFETGTNLSSDWTQTSFASSWIVSAGGVRSVDGFFTQALVDIGIDDDISVEMQLSPDNLSFASRAFIVIRSDGNEDSGNSLLLGFDSSTGFLTLRDGWSIGSTGSTIATSDTEDEREEAHTIRAEIVGDTIKGFVDDVERISYTLTGSEANDYSSGNNLNWVGLGLQNRADARHVLNFEVLSGISATIPDAPDFHTVTAGDQQAQLDWDTPSNDGGDAITNYDIEYKLSSSGTWTDFTHTPSTNTEATITGLTRGEIYDFRVAAINSQGTSAYSGQSNISLPDVPSKNTASATSTGYFSIQISWTVPSDGGSPITGYEIKWYNQSTSELVGSTTTDSSSSSLNVENLTENTSYYTTVSAINSIGTAEASDQATVTTDALPEPEPESEPTPKNIDTNTHEQTDSQSSISTTYSSSSSSNTPQTTKKPIEEESKENASNNEQEQNPSNDESSTEQDKEQESQSTNPLIILGAVSAGAFILYLIGKSLIK